MKNILKIITIIFLSFAFIAIIKSCKKETLPNVTTVAITGITQTSAVSVGNVTDDGGTEVTAYGVCWDTSKNPTTNASKTNDGKGTGVFVSNITDLSENTKYNVRAYATNSEGTSYGNEISFTTIQTQVPSLKTVPVTSITQTTAVTGGNITSDGGASITERGVCWDTSPNPSINWNRTNDGNGIGDFLSNVIGLKDGTNYYIRSYATNSAGTGYGNEVSFTTIQIVLPTITTSEVRDILITSAVSGGNITSNGGGTIKSRGVCWNTFGTPNIKDDDFNDNYMSDADEGREFSVWLVNLKRGTNYYVRAYATNEAGTAYGNQLSFTSVEEVSPIIEFNTDLIYASLTDIDGNIYRTIRIVDQNWMAENLKTTKLNDGTEIPRVEDNSNWQNLKAPGYCWYDNDEYYKSFYGALYNWYTVNTKKLCPAGWHVPTDLDWSTLIDYLDWEGVAGGPLKEVGTSHWLYPNTGATNESGFTALPGGLRYEFGAFSGIGWLGLWWSSTDYSLLGAYRRTMRYDEKVIYRTSDYKSLGTSIRCIQD